MRAAMPSMLPSESTLRSAAPSLAEPEPKKAVERMVIAGGTLVELHPPRLGQADVMIEGATIAQVGGEMPADAPRVDASGCFVMPAFVIAHTHLYLSLATGMPPPPSTPKTLTDTLQWIWWTLDKALDDELVHTSALVGAAAAAKAGAAVVVDLHSSPRAIDGSLDRIEAALDEVGLLGVLAYETTDREGRGRRDAALKENRRFLERVRTSQSRHRALVGAHAMFSLNDDTLDALRDLADVYSVGIHMHVAEDGTDRADAERNRKTTLDKRLERVGLARAGSVMAHAIHLDAAQIDLVTQAGGYVATNPRSNMAHGVGLFTGGGPRVALGTDGIDGDLLAEARTHHLRHSEARDGFARETGLRIAAGQELAFPGGSRIAPGGRANLTILDYCPMTPMTASNVIDHVARNLVGAHVRDTIVEGRFVLRDRKLVSVDERELVLRARAAASRLWERMQGYH
jgi:cytosine/adenosine deaminase-related metal-dependent hydrolase